MAKLDVFKKNIFSESEYICINDTCINDIIKNNTKVDTSDSSSNDTEDDNYSDKFRFCNYLQEIKLKRIYKIKKQKTNNIIGNYF